VDRRRGESLGENRPGRWHDVRTERHEVAAEHDRGGIEHGRERCEAGAQVTTEDGERLSGVGVACCAVGGGDGGLQGRLLFIDPDRGEHRAQAYGRLPAPPPPAAALALGVADRHVADLSGEPGGAAYEPAVLHDAGADADRAGDVERVADVRADTVSGFRQRRTVGVVVDRRGAGIAERFLELCSEVPTVPAQVRCPRHGAVVVGDQARDGDRRADDAVSVGDEGRTHVRGQLDELTCARRGAGCGDRSGLDGPDGAGQVQGHRGHVVDVDLQPESEDRLTRQCDGTSGPPATRRDGVVLGHGVSPLQLGDDRADRGLRQSGAPGQLGPRGRAVDSQRAQHEAGVLPAHVLGPTWDPVQGHPPRTP
jgi:hypothetical protein